MTLENNVKEPVATYILMRTIGGYLASEALQLLLLNYDFFVACSPSRKCKKKPQKPQPQTPQPQKTASKKNAKNRNRKKPQITKPQKTATAKTATTKNRK